MRARLEALIDEMLDGHILLAEAVSEFEKLYIKKALTRNKEHLSKTAQALGIHRNTISKRVAEYQKKPRPLTRTARSGVR
jgi:transcriptional regulator with PAS, ATPase and Fis domain